jgi:hypothetical protein
LPEANPGLSSSEQFNYRTHIDFRCRRKLLCVARRIESFFVPAGVIWERAIWESLMRRISTFLMGMATGAMLLHGATMYHLVRAADGFHFIPKQPPRLAETYVDIRAFTMEEWAGHPQLASAAVQAGQQQLLGDAAAGTIQETLNSALPARLKQ